MTNISSALIPKHTKILGIHFVHCIKDVYIACPLHKALLVVQVHRGREKNELVHTSTTLRMHYIRLNLAYVAIIRTIYRLMMYESHIFNLIVHFLEMFFSDRMWIFTCQLVHYSVFKPHYMFCETQALTEDLYLINIS